MERVGTSGTIPSQPTPAPRETTSALAWRYGRDLARLHLVDPEKVFLFWEITDETARRARGRPGKLALRLLRIEATDRVVTTAESVFAVMTWYFSVEPRGRYRGELGWLSPDGAFETWLASNEVETPSREPNVTAEVVFTAPGERRTRRTAARGPGALGPGGQPSARPKDAVSAAGARRREAAREVARAPWSGSVVAWSRTARPAKKP